APPADLVSRQILTSAPMTGILDRVAAQAFGKFRPQTVQDYFALRLAQKLGEAPAAAYFRTLVDQHSEERLLVAYRRALVAKGFPDLGRAFHAALGHMNGNGGSHSYGLLAIKIERRSVAVAYFIGTQLDYAQNHHLPSEPEKAGGSAMSFVNLMIAQLKK